MTTDPIQWWTVQDPCTVDGQRRPVGAVDQPVRYVFIRDDSLENALRIHVNSAHCQRMHVHTHTHAHTNISIWPSSSIKFTVRLQLKFFHHVHTRKYALMNQDYSKSIFKIVLRRLCAMVILQNIVETKAAWEMTGIPRIIRE